MAFQMLPLSCREVTVTQSILALSMCQGLRKATGFTCRHPCKTHWNMIPTHHNKHPPTGDAEKKGWDWIEIGKPWMLEWWPSLLTGTVAQFTSDPFGTLGTRHQLEHRSNGLRIDLISGFQRDFLGWYDLARVSSLNAKCQQVPPPTSSKVQPHMQWKSSGLEMILPWLSSNSSIFQSTSAHNELYNYIPLHSPQE